MDLLLTPVVEFEPGAYSKGERAPPSVGSSQDPGAWDVYWRDCLGDAGISDLEPIAKGSWLVPVERLVGDRVLDMLLRVALDGVSEWCPDLVGSIAGGYVLSTAGERLEPGCCGDLSNLADWRAVAEQYSDDWTMVWIGHPWTHASAQSDVITILRASEDDVPTNPQPFCSVERDVLRSAIETASEQIRLFGERLSPRIGAMYPSAPVNEALGILLRGHTSSG